MTAQRLKITLASVAILVTGIAVAAAQGPMHHGGGHEGHMMGFLTRQLDLTEAQQAQVKDIFGKEKSTIHPLMLQKMQLHEQLMQEAISNTSNPSKIQGLAAQEGQLETALTVEHAKIASEIFNILTPEQKTKAQQLLQQHQQRMQQHMQHMQQGGEDGPPPPEE